MFMCVFSPNVSTVSPKNNVLPTELFDDPAAQYRTSTHLSGFPPFEGHLHIHQHNINKNQYDSNSLIKKIIPLK